MTSITFIHPDGRTERVDTGDAESVMLAAIACGVEGILAECGGNAMCATCHVYVDESWHGRLPAMSDAEDALLDGAAADRSPTSRLSCQLKITTALDGLVLRVPERQV